MKACKWVRQQVGRLSTGRFSRLSLSLSTEKQPTATTHHGHRYTNPKRNTLASSPQYRMVLRTKLMVDRKHTIFTISLTTEHGDSSRALTKLTQIWPPTATKLLQTSRFAETLSTWARPLITSKRPESRKARTQAEPSYKGKLQAHSDANVQGSVAVVGEPKAACFHRALTMARLMVPCAA